MRQAIAQPNSLKIIPPASPTPSSFVLFVSLWLLAIFTAILLALSFVFVIVNMLFGPMLVGLIVTHAVNNRLEVFRAAKRS